MLGVDDIIHNTTNIILYAVYCTLTWETLIYDCFTAQPLLNAEVCVYIDHKQRYFCSHSCFPFAICHCHVCWQFVPKYTQAEKLTCMRSYWSSTSGTTLRCWYFASGAVTGQRRGERNWRVCSLCCLDLWGQGQEGSQWTHGKTRTEAFFVLKLFADNTLHCFIQRKIK